MVSNDFNESIDSSATLCEWLNDGTSPDDLSIVTERPWAKTYRLSRDGQARYLKVIPAIQAGAISALPALSAHFPDIVPATVAVNESRGLVLMEDHGGTDMKRRATHEKKQQILTTYAAMQADAVDCDDLIASLPRLDCTGLVSQLLTFLNPEATEGRYGPALAKDFFDEDRCVYYYELFSARAEPLRDLIRASEKLPVTINHCDLRPGNAAIKDNGDVVIYDWDEAVAGPAGLSLHNYSSGCAAACQMLLRPSIADRPDWAKYRKLIGTYMRALAKSGYARPDQLTAGVPGAICAGVIHYVLSYARFMPPDDAYRDEIADIMRGRLNDLLDLADFLSAQSRDTTSRLADDYWQRDRGDRACQLLSMFAERNPDDLEMQLRLADSLQQEGESDEATAVVRELIPRFPESGQVHRRFGLSQLEQLEFESAVEHLSNAIELGVPQDEELLSALDEATDLLAVCRHAELPDEVPTITISESEQAGGELTVRKRRLAIRLFRKYGTLLIENAFPADTVQELHETYLDRYQRYFVNRKHEDALKVGSKRYMITVDIDGPFNSPRVYANPFVEPIIQAMLGEDMIMGGFNSVCSLPESENMKIHKDHPALFPDSRDPDNGQSFAITAVVGLRGFNAEAGTTRVFKGSHKCSSNKAVKLDHQDPEGPPGTCLLMDYRLNHQGRANRSDEVRPILTMIYHRPWFRDIVNYGMQDPLRITDKAFDDVPKEHRPLFDWSRSSD